jgi:O-antigen ligase/polysaccharide polymerase Wzy-like membrane protein
MSAELGVVSAGWRSSDEYEARAARSSWVLGAAAVCLAAVFAVLVIASEGDLRLVAPLVAVLVVTAIVAHPIVGLFLLFGAALVLEQYPILGIEPLTAQTRFFQNLSAYTAVPLRLSACDLLMLLTIGSCARRSATARIAFRTGPFGQPIALYGAAFVIGTAIGAARGGAWDPDTALAELRGPLYLCASYFVAVNLIRERAHLVALIWGFVLIAGAKSIQGIFNYQVSLGLPYGVDAVTSHEDVVFFDAAVVLAVLAVILGLRNKLTYALLAVQPVILLAELLTQRRVAFVALGTALVAVAMLVFAVAPRRALLVVAAGIVALGLYLAVFAEDTGPLGEPVRAIRSVIDPSSVEYRDQLSNAWRDIEDRNIQYTVQQLPLTGVGVGQEYLFREEPPKLWGFTYWRYMTHNAVLWLWLKAGPLGAFALWFLAARVILLGTRWSVHLRDGWLRWAAAFPVVLLICQIVFSSVDLGLTYSRPMIVLGTVLGIGAFLAAQPQRAENGTGKKVPA